ncbi:hypothetical protein PAMA_009881 [Pampus argenteus]
MDRSTDDFTQPEGGAGMDGSAPADGKKFAMNHGATNAKAPEILASDSRQPEDQNIKLNPFAPSCSVIDTATNMDRSTDDFTQPEGGAGMDGSAPADGKKFAMNHGATNAKAPEILASDSRQPQEQRDKPSPIVPPCSVIDTATNMDRSTDDFTQPEGGAGMDGSAPADGKKFAMNHGATNAKAPEILASDSRQPEEQNIKLNPFAPSCSVM